MVRQRLLLLLTAALPLLSKIAWQGKGSQLRLSNSVVLANGGCRVLRVFRIKSSVLRSSTFCGHDSRLARTL